RPCGCGTSLVHFPSTRTKRATRATTATAPVSTGRRCGGPAMRWQMGRRSDNIEDRRGMPVGRGAAVGGGIGTLLLVLLAMYFGVDPSVIPAGNRPGQLAAIVERPATLGRRRSAARFRLGHPRRYRGHVARALPPDEPGVSGAAPGAVQQRGTVGLRLRRGGGIVTCATRAARQATSLRPTSSPMRWATTSKTS